VWIEGKGRIAVLAADPNTPSSSSSPSPLSSSSTKTPFMDGVRRGGGEGMPLPVGKK